MVVPCCPPGWKNSWQILALVVVHAQRLNVLNEVTGYLGKKVVLPCSFVTNNPEIQIIQLSWVKQTDGKKQNVAVFHPDHGPSYPMERDSRRIRFRSPSMVDATLIIDPLLTSDEGTYTCDFVTHPLGKVVANTELIIAASTQRSHFQLTKSPDKA